MVFVFTFDTQTRLMELGWSQADANTAADAAYDSARVNNNNQEIINKRQ